MQQSKIPPAYRLEVKNSDCKFQIKLTYGKMETSLKLGNTSVFFIKSVYPGSKQELINKILLASIIPTIVPGRGSNLTIVREGKFVKLTVTQTSGKKQICEAKLDEIEVFLFCKALKKIIMIE